MTTLKKLRESIYGPWDKNGKLHDPDSHGMIAPKWLHDKMGERERKIINHPYSKGYRVDSDGEILPSHHQIIASPDGHFTIDSKRKEIIS